MSDQREAITKTPTEKFNRGFLKILYISGYTSGRGNTPARSAISGTLCSHSIAIR